MSSKNLKSKSLKNISSLIQKESRTAVLFVHTVAENMNMQITDIRCLDYLMDVNSATAGDLAKITGLTTGATTAMIDRLEKTKFVKRETDPTDRRKIIITFINKNFRRSNIATNFFEKNIPKLLNTYTSKEQELIKDWNEKLISLFKNEIKRIKNIK
ncbi:MAG: MarR family transcriptional regulator [Candidatus Moranbacteria bacterium]|nr:MarR family transcriptional regulator [Candidatus Moranbacteria bacterium]